MSELIQFDLKKIKAGDTTELKSYISDAERAINRSKSGNEVNYNPLSVIDAKAQQPGYLEEFTRGFNVQLGLPANKGVSFNQLEETQERKSFDVTGSSVATTIGTDIIPTVEALIRDTSLLSRIQINQSDKPNNSKQLWDFNVEQDAAVVSEVATGTDVDDAIRRNDTLIPQYKVQASAKFSEYGLSTMTAQEEGQFVARLARRVQSQLITQILSGGSAAANGTAKNGIRGINNNFGVNGTGDATNFIGAITFGTKALADAALPAASSDAYDLAVKVKRILLPANLSEVEENSYVYIMNRYTWGVISTLLDGNGRYKSGTSIDPTTGKAVKMIDGTEVIIVPTASCPDNFVHLAPLNMYELFTFGGIMNLNDGGIVQLREGLTSFVSRIWADGSMRYGHKYLNNTVATIGTTPVNNQAQNAFRYFRIT